MAPWPEPGAERHIREVDPGITEALGDDAWKPTTLDDLIERGVPVIRFYCPLDGSVYTRLRVLSRREVRRQERRKRRANLPLAKRRRRDRIGGVIALVVTVVVMGAIMKMPDPPPWVHTQSPTPASKVLNP
jgi:hypothetical protein